VRAGDGGADDATTVNGSSGVTRVTNLITVVPAAAASEIKKAIEQALVRSRSHEEKQ
jgi:hypothetical protein